MGRRIPFHRHLARPLLNPSPDHWDREPDLSDTPTIAVTPPPRQPVRAAIASAARATGVNFDYLLAQAKIESGLNPSARAPTSSAAGLYQFTRGTWLATLEKHAGKHGLGWVQDAISGGTVTDPQMRAQIMALRFDPQASALMAGDSRSVVGTLRSEGKKALSLDEVRSPLFRDGRSRDRFRVALEPVEAKVGDELPFLVGKY